jgi:glycolate oxidase iron-sulfur subunit
MQTTLAPGLRAAPAAAEAAELIGACVHCGFCNAACPTYRLLGDELDGPRGRIYLVRGLLETGTATAVTQQHLDRCLTCRACEPACPSGVQYGRIVDLGRELAQAATPRQRLAEAAAGGAAARVDEPDAVRRPASRWRGGAGRCCPRRCNAGCRLQRRLHLSSRRRCTARPPRRRSRARRPSRAACCASRAACNRRCSQGPARPPRRCSRCSASTACSSRARAAAARCASTSTIRLGALDAARRNIDAWWPQIEAGAEAIVMDASACGLMLREYGARLQHDPEYAARAARVSALVLDVAELVEREAPQLTARLATIDHGGSGSASASRPRVAFHPPCTLQHGQRLRGVVEALLARAGAEVVPFADAQQCCGSAGAWSLLEPELAEQLRTRKLAALEAARPDLILSANIGCIAHLAAASGTPVLHWIEWLASRLGVAPR